MPGPAQSGGLNLTITTRPEQPVVQHTVQEEIEVLFRLANEDAGELLLVRHAQSAAGLLPDPEASVSPDPMLSCEGLRQAERLAAHLSSLWLDAVYTAPERRCLQTARIVADALQRPLSVLPDLAEIAFDPEAAAVGPSGYAERFSRHPRWECLPGFSSGTAFRRRTVSAIESVVAAHPGRRSVVVTHTSVINAYLGRLLRIPRDLFFAPDHASVCTVRYRDGMYALRSLNDTSHLVLRDPIPALLPALTLRSLPLTNR